LFVQHHFLVGPLFEYAGDTDTGVFAEILGVEEQPQSRFAGLYESAVVGSIDVVVPHFARHGSIAGGSILLIAALHVRHAGSPHG